VTAAPKRVEGLVPFTRFSFVGALIRGLLPWSNVGGQVPFTTLPMPKLPGLRRRTPAPPQTPLVAATRTVDAQQKVVSDATKPGLAEKIAIATHHLSDEELAHRTTKAILTAGGAAGAVTLVATAAIAPAFSIAVATVVTGYLATRLFLSGLGAHTRHAQQKDPGAKSSMISEPELKPLLDDFHNKPMGLEKALLGELLKRTRTEYADHLLEGARRALDLATKTYGETVPDELQRIASAYFTGRELILSARTEQDAAAFQKEFFQALPEPMQDTLRPALYDLAFNGRKSRQERDIGATQILYHLLASPESAKARVKDLLQQIDWSRKNDSSGGALLSTSEVNRIIESLERMPEDERPVAQAAVRKALFNGNEPKLILADPDNDYDNLHRAVFSAV
jgi:hypothetical protein